MRGDRRSERTTWPCPSALANVSAATRLLHCPVGGRADHQPNLAVARRGASAHRRRDLAPLAIPALKLRQITIAHDEAAALAVTVRRSMPSNQQHLLTGSERHRINSPVVSQLRVGSTSLDRERQS